ncbi:activity-regulated cytoskeleton associated protein 2-like [Musca autumnalis]|uniref:activity-regulated cytoskeleton associated protein 2-like n=1 Tax=Musca autumnalis TaxID=221902 RepID=UPI003CED5825
MAQFTDAQFQQLIQAMRRIGRAGSFAHCTARFKGERDAAVVEEFVTAISVYKEIESITDADAVKGLQLLFEGYAANWWIGVKHTITTFDPAIQLIKKTPLPDWRIFASIVETKQQQNEPTDSFVCKQRLLFAQLAVPVSEEVQLNIVFGLLNTNIRERVRRENVKTFEDLLSTCREAELTLHNKGKPKCATEFVRCRFCRETNHSEDLCKKLEKRVAPQQQQQDEYAKTQLKQEQTHNVRGDPTEAAVPS